MILLQILEVTLHMRSGLTLKARVHEITQRYSGDELVGLKWKGGKMPFYFCMKDITAITTRKVINWRRGFIK